MTNTTDRFAAARAAKAAKARDVASALYGKITNGEVKNVQAGVSERPRPAKAKEPAQPLADDWGSMPNGGASASDKSDGWGVVDLGAQRNELPAPGWHVATIADVKVTGAGGLALWCSISYGLNDTQAVVQEMQPIAAKPTAPADHRQRVKGGQIMLGRVQRATGADLTGAKLTDIGERLIGKSCFVLVAHGEQYGVPILNLRGVADRPK